jgi:predicted patatin/cPLA2 family phospholipase
MIADHTGLVLEGGGFRGIFTAGILDAFLKEGIHFPYLIGVSAGAAYGVSYVSRQYGRNLAVNRIVADKRYCSVGNFLKTGNYFNWDFVYREVPLHIVPFDYASFASSGQVFRVGLTNCATGLVEFYNIEGSSPERFRDLLAATSALPLVSRMQLFEGRMYMDGGIADAVPVNRALEEGNTRVVVILTRPRGYRKQPSLFDKLIALSYRRYPQFVKTMRERVDRYNRTLDMIEQLEAAGTAFVIRPAIPVPVSRMENKPAKLNSAYWAAVEEGQGMIPGLKEWLSGSDRPRNKVRNAPGT